MTSPTETAALPRTPEGLAGFLGSFHRYGLPGVVIGVQFLIIAYQLHISTATNIQSAKAMAEMAAAMVQVKDALKEMNR